jgi:hypothetical protein
MFQLRNKALIPNRLESFTNVKESILHFFTIFKDGVAVWYNGHFLIDR